MTDLSEKKCIPCEGNIPSFKLDEIHKYLKKVDGWNVKSNKEKNYFLEKEFKFKNFKNSQAFVNKVGEIAENEIYFLEKNFTFKNFSESQKFVNEVGNIAETEGHHPDIIFGWGYAKIQIFTHKIKGLVESDFILAAKVDKIKF